MAVVFDFYHARWARGTHISPCPPSKPPGAHMHAPRQCRRRCTSRRRRPRSRSRRRLRAGTRGGDRGSPAPCSRSPWPARALRRGADAPKARPPFPAGGDFIKRGHEVAISLIGWLSHGPLIPTASSPIHAISAAPRKSLRRSPLRFSRAAGSRSVLYSLSRPQLMQQSPPRPVSTYPSM